MKKILVIICVLLVSGCILTKQATDEWLALKTGSTTYDLTGQYDSGGMMTGGWGHMRIFQEGPVLNGTVGLYSFTGAINGNKLYLVLFDQRTYYYTCALVIKDINYITGTCYQSTLAESEDAKQAIQYPMLLNRVGR